MLSLLVTALCAGQALDPSIELSVTSVSPAMHAAAPVDTDVVIEFDQPLDRASLTSAPNHFHVFGEQSGPVTGTLAFENGDRRLRFDPERDFFAGETVRVTVSHFVRGAYGSVLRSAGYVYEFRTQTAPAQLDFAPVDGLTARRTPDEPVRVYGGLASDFDGDGYLDLALIDEDSDDCRLLRNRADGSGHFHDLTDPPSPLGSRPSPGQVVDFDVDGVTDVVASNTSGSTVSVLRGLGGGTFAPALTLATHDVPRGLAALEMNGDGFIDLATSNWTDSSGDVALMINDGQGGFLPTTYIDAGITHEFSIDAADMNNDGIQDLVVAGRESQTVSVLLGTGAGTFAPWSMQSSGGQTWRLLCGDMNGDGFMDATVANGFSNNGAVLLNDGQGHLLPPIVQTAAGYTTDTNVGDLDGDGDLDWTLSNFNGRTSKIFLNDGSAGFTFFTEFHAIDKPAGVVMLDLDGDGDLDLVLMDELADVLTFLENQDGPTRLLCFGDGSGATCPCSNPGLPGHGCDNAQSTGGVNVAPAFITPLGPGVGMAEFVATGFPPAGHPPIIPIRSLGTINAGDGAPFADGVLCLTSPVARLLVNSPTNGTAVLPINHMAGPGTFYYQLIYRNQSPTFCTPDQLNTSNALWITWP
jgi:FG-GAP-like repeat/Bacterial Ig-like domain